MICAYCLCKCLQIERYSAQYKGESSSTLTRLESGYWFEQDENDYFYYELKTVTMNRFRGEPLELDFANHLIKKALKLQRMIICCDKHCSELHTLATRSLLLRASFQLNIVIESAQSRTR